MASVTLRLPENIVHKIDMNAHALHMTRSEYIKKAILDMNHEIQERERKRKLAKASQCVREESMSINAEFMPVENDPKA
jgi:predicted transcriptional regulator